MNYKEIVDKLIGKLSPVGNSEIDAERFENLEEMCALVDELIDEIRAVGAKRDWHEASVKKAASLADGFLERLSEKINEELNPAPNR